MGSIGGLLGTAGGAAGTGFKSPQAAQIQAPVTQQQVQQSQAGAQSALSGQQALLAALQGQGGLAAQNQALGQQQALSGQLAGAGGIGAQTGAISGLQGVAGLQAGTLGQLQGIANGTGPNPAQAALNQNTAVNVANQAALMAGQRGAGSNVGLLARQSAQQGAATQQQAAGQAATMQAQQELGAIGQQAGVEQGMAGTQQALAGVGQGLTAQQQAASTAQAQQAAQIAGQQIGATGALTGAQQAQQNAYMGSLGQLNQTNVAQQGGINTANAGLAQTQMKGQQDLIGGALQAAGPSVSAGLGALAKGGEVRKMADGGAPDAPAAPAPPAPPVAPGTGPQSGFGQALSTMGQSMNPQDQSDPLKKGSASFFGGIAKGLQGGPKPPPEGTQAGPDSSGLGDIPFTAAQGGLAATGGDVAAKKPSQKAVKAGNSYDNDKVPAMLSEGEVVLPRSVMQSKDPVKSSAEFVAKVLAKKGKK